MPTLLSLEINQVVHFQHAKLDVTQRPMTVISGHNKDSLISGDTSNGAGKSLFWSAFPNLIYDATPLSTSRMKAQSRKEMLADKESHIIAIIKSDWGKVYTVEQRASSITIFEDGVDMEIRLAKDQRLMLQKIFPITEEEFYSYIYLQSQRNLRFQIDKPSERLHHITDLFNLNVYDRLKSYFTKKLGEIKQVQVEHDVVSAALVRSNQMLERLNWTRDDKDELDRATAHVDKARSKMRTLQAEVERLKIAQSDAQRYAKAEKSLSAIKSKMSDKDIQTYMEGLQDKERYEKQMASYQSQYDALNGQLEALGKCVDRTDALKEISDRQDVLEEELQELVSQRKEYRAAEEKRELYAEKIRSIKVRKELRELSEKELQKELRHHDTVLEFEKILRDCEDGECPTCMQTVDVKKYQKQINASKKAMEGVTQALERKAYQRQLKELEVKSFPQELYDKKKARYKLLTDKEELYEEQNNNFQRQRMLRDMIGLLEKPKKTYVEHKYTREQLKRYYDQNADIRKYKNILSSITVLQGVEEALLEASAALRKMEVRYGKAQKVIITNSARYGEYRALRREQKKQEQALTALQPIIEQRDLTKSLEKAYSSKGLKVNAANLILTQIEGNLNRYSNLIFAEPFKFTLRAKSDGVHCIVDRGAKSKPSDISRLSGAESDCFRLLWMWVMLVMAEPSKRTNFVVLDEPDAHMDTSTRNLFIERYLPMLRTLVPNVYLITPKSKDDFTDCAYLTVVKHKGISKLIEDSSDEGVRLRLQPTRSDTDAAGKGTRTKKKKR